MNEQEKKLDDVPDTRDQLEESKQRMQEKHDVEQVPVTGVKEKEETAVPLFEQTEAEKFRSHWLDIQSRFVDDPRDSVKKADELVADVIKSLTNTFAQKRIAMENEWNSGNSASTEDLRIAIKRYRTFFDRLLMLES